MPDQPTGYIKKGPEVTENGLFNIGWPNFGLTSMATQYSMAKLAGYIFQATYSDSTKWVERNILKNKAALTASPKAKQYFDVFEAVSFALISSISFFMEKSNFKTHIYDAIAAERAMQPEKVSIFSMYKSDNPFIRSLRDRFTLQNATRIPGSLLFAKSLTAGIVALSVNFTLERSIFVENNAYDLLRNMLFEVQKLKTSGQADTDRVYTGLERAVQRSLSDNHRLTLSKEQLQANKPVFERLTKNVMVDRFKVAECIYILGEMANHPDQTAKMVAEIETMERVGIKGLARQKAGMGAEGTAAGRIVEQGKQSFMQRAAGPANLQPGVA